MAVNEAPRLTKRVVALWMIAVFLLCLAADQFQCKKNGRQYLCSGEAPYHCDSDYCREEVRVASSYTSYRSCLFKGTSELLFAFVEVGPSLVSDRGSTVSAYMAEELRERIRKNTFPSFLKESAEFETSRRGPYDMVDKFFMFSRSMESLQQIMRNTTRCNVSTDVVTLPPYQGKKPFAHLSWAEAVEAVLPTSRLDDPTQLATYFPNLHASLDAAVKRQKQVRTNSQCDTLHLVVYVLLSPLASVRTVWEIPSSARQSVNDGYSWTSGAISRYISTNKHYRKHLNRVQYMYLYASSPARAFVKKPCKRYYSRLENEAAVAADTAVSTAVTDEAAAVAFCNVSSEREHASRCLQGCEGYASVSTIAAVRDGSFCNALYDRGDGIFRTYFAASPLYMNCYFDILANVTAPQANGTPPEANGTFHRDVEAQLFDDCLHLSPKGGKAFASCLLKSKGYRNYNSYYY